MKTRYIWMVGGLAGGIFVSLGAVVLVSYLLHGKSTTSTGSSDSTVAAQVVTSKPLYSGQQEQVYQAVQQMLQAPNSVTSDASGFVQSVYAKVGVQLPRTIAEQAQAGAANVAVDQLQKGDLVFFNLGGGNDGVTFDGIYLGGNQFAAVTSHGLMAIHLDDPYWAGKFVFGRRVL